MAPTDADDGCGHFILRCESVTGSLEAIIIHLSSCDFQGVKEAN
jgi:hypothetical protein